jgi:hypothetical protein
MNKHLYRSLIITVTLFSLANTAQANTITINNPKIQNYALDFCEVWGARCGLPAATAYCKSKGYVSAVSFKVKKNTPPTKVIKGGGICVEGYCDRISQVKCKLPAPKKKVYWHPKVGNYALDFCREWGTNCGTPAATAFCKSKGHKYALSFKVKHNSPTTKVIHGGGLCVEPYCDRIDQVVCKL